MILVKLNITYRLGVLKLSSSYRFSLEKAQTKKLIHLISKAQQIIF